MQGSQRQKIAFVLPGGGSLGAIQVGMLKALLQNAITPDFIVGSSVGALNSAHFAQSPTNAGVAHLEEIWRGLRRRDVFPTGYRMMWPLLQRGEFHFETAPLRKLIKTHLPYTQIEETTLPLHILATDFLTGEAVILSSGPVAEAILASSAIPGVFAPVKYGSRYLTDGEFAAGTALRAAASLGAERIYLLPVNFPCQMSHPPKGSIAHIFQSVNLMMARQLLADRRELGTSVQITVVPPLCPLSGSSYSFTQTASLIDRAFDSTQNWIAGGHYESCELPPAMLPHRHA